MEHLPGSDLVERPKIEMSRVVFQSVHLDRENHLGMADRVAMGKLAIAVMSRVVFQSVHLVRGSHFGMADRVAMGKVAIAVLSRVVFQNVHLAKEGLLRGTAVAATENVVMVGETMVGNAAAVKGHEALRSLTVDGQVEMPGEGVRVIQGVVSGAVERAAAQSPGHRSLGARSARLLDPLALTRRALLYVEDSVENLETFF